MITMRKKLLIFTAGVVTTAVGLSPSPLREIILISGIFLLAAAYGILILGLKKRAVLSQSNIVKTHAPALPKPTSSPLQPQPSKPPPSSTPVTPLPTPPRELHAYRYEEFKVRFSTVAEDKFSILASGPSGEATGQFVIPFSRLEIDNFLLRMGQTRRGVRSFGSPEMALAMHVGSKLFTALFQDRVRDVYRASVDEVRKAEEGLRITLDLTSAPELMHLPWEYLYDDPNFLSISAWTPIVRYLDLPIPRLPLTVEPPLRILAMVSSPSDLVSLDVEAERKKLEQALGELVERRVVAIDWLEQASLRELQRRLRHGVYHIFHYIGHGTYDSVRRDGFLALEEGEDEHSRSVSGTELGTILHDHTSLRLAVLNACEGARTSLEDPFAGVASSLVQHEIPAVVAMQFEITDRAAVVFSEEFYSALCDGFPVDAALAEARKGIYGDKNDVEWGTPVLFMRVADGRIFDISVR